MKFLNYNTLKLILSVVRYNLKIIFANKFVYFMLAALGIFLLILVIYLFDANSEFDAADVYNTLLLPGLLIIFYPSTFGIQNDVDSRMIEILFGIPNYRYKVWLVRLSLIYLIVSAFLIGLCFLSVFVFTVFSPVEMVYQLMFPVFFLGCLAFMTSTLVRNGYGTAAVMVFVGLVFWIVGGIFEDTKYNIFLNPFEAPRRVNEIVWQQIIIDNRIYLFVGTILAVLAGLLNLQKREKFI